MISKELKKQDGLGFSYFVGGRMVDLIHSTPKVYKMFKLFFIPVLAVTLFLMGTGKYLSERMIIMTILSFTSAS